MKRAMINLAILALALAATRANACPACKDSISTTSAKQAAAVPAGFNASIYCLLVGVAGAAGLVSVSTYRACREISDRESPTSQQSS